MFVLKKLITSFLLPPGLIILSLLVVACFTKKRLRLGALILAGFVYLLSIEPTTEFFLKPLEDAYKPPPLSDIHTSDAYVILGSGALENVPDIDGNGALGSSSLPRVITAYRLYRIHPKPIIISSGKIFNRGSETKIAKRFLISFGVPGNHIIEETKSVDTFENAQYTKEIADTYRLKKIVLITSAFHMKRSYMLFGRHFKEIVPYPTDYLTSRVNYDILSFLPGAGSLSAINTAMKEYLGILFYGIQGLRSTSS